MEVRTTRDSSDCLALWLFFGATQIMFGLLFLLPGGCCTRSRTWTGGNAKRGPAAVLLAQGVKILWGVLLPPALRGS